MIAPIIYKSTGSHQDCRRGCAQGSTVLAASIFPKVRSSPRSAGTFTRFLAQYVRERKLITWPDAIAKTSYLPAKLLEESVPQMHILNPLSHADVRVRLPSPN